ncbi:MAG: 23S rRNA (pseudouridine(1915)-N(3))-methyltransferase RlmH [Flavobacteriales bacterium]|jgi:23S rRNA (pseudouridine1915-N3)-methyltransferase
MNIRLILVGKTTTPFVKDGLDIYFNRLKHYCKFDVLELPDGKLKDPEKQKEAEALAILKAIKPDDFLVLLDEKGVNPTSREFAQYLQKKMNAGTKQLVLLVGGAFGFTKEVYDRADYQLSFSKMTFSHEMIRVFIAEQVYRAFTILKGESYHND